MNPQLNDAGLSVIPSAVTVEARDGMLPANVPVIANGFSLANTGQAKVGAESFTTFSPTFFFGKGFGDLPDSMSMLKPLAITGTFAGNIPSRARDSQRFQSGQYGSSQGRRGIVHHVFSHVFLRQGIR